MKTFTDTERLNFLLTNRFVVKHIECNPDMWMVLDETGYPVSGGEHSTALEALDAEMEALL